MKRSIVFICVIIIPTISLLSQTLSSVFLNIPDNVVLGLSIDDKKQLLSGTKDSVVSVENVFSGEIKRLGISEDYIALQTSEAGTLQIKLLPLINNSKIICVVKTVCARACDSYIHFFTTDWDSLGQSGLFPEKDISWFVKAGINKSSEEFKDAIIAIDMLPVKFILSDSSYIVKAEYDASTYLTKEDAEKIKPFLNDSKVFTWNNIVFKD
jgi:hypothetical protein